MRERLRVMTQQERFNKFNCLLYHLNDICFKLQEIDEEIDLLLPDLNTFDEFDFEDYNDVLSFVYDILKASKSLIDKMEIETDTI